MLVNIAYRDWSSDAIDIELKHQTSGHTTTAASKNASSGGWPPPPLGIYIAPTSITYNTIAPSAQVRKFKLAKPYL